jgi:protease-4
LSPWDDATRDRVFETMTGIYSLFLARVAEGRNIPVETVAASAEGRIFSGRDGKQRGLVDELGGLKEAIARARSMAGLAADAEVDLAAEPSGLVQTLIGDNAQSELTEAPGGSATALGELGARVAAALGEAVQRAAPGVRPFAASMLPLAAGEHALCALPFALTVR